MHCRLIHEIWQQVGHEYSVESLCHLFVSQALQNRTYIWVERVPSHDNISDSPSRCAYGLMKEMGATWKKPVIASLFLNRGPSTHSQCISV